MLYKGEASVGHITHTLKLTQSNVSHQLKSLKQAGLVKSSRHGQSMIYSIDDRHVSTLLKQAIQHAHHQRVNNKCLITHTIITILIIMSIPITKGINNFFLLL